MNSSKLKIDSIIGLNIKYFYSAIKLYFYFTTTVAIFFLIQIVTSYIAVSKSNQVIIFSNKKDVLHIFPELYNLRLVYSFNTVSGQLITNPLIEKIILLGVCSIFMGFIYRKIKLENIFYLVLVNFIFFIALYVFTQNPFVFIFLIFFFIDRCNKYLINFFLFSLTIYITFLLFTYQNFEITFAFSELVINYSGGFVRRGFLGAILGLFKNYKVYYFFSFAVFYFFLFLYLKNYLYREKNSMLSLFFIFNPLTIGYVIKNYIPLFGRKDFLILIFALIISEKIINNKLPKKFEQSLYFLFLIFLVLTYELIIFFIPFYLIKIYNSYNKEDIKKQKILIAGLISNFVLGVALTLRFNSVPDFNKLCNDLLFRYGESVATCKGAPLYLSLQRSDYQNEVFSHISFQQLTYWGALFFYVILVNLLFYKKINVYENLTLFVFLLPVFLYAQDWGRWFYIIFIHNILFSNPKFKFSENTLKLVTFVSIIFLLYFEHFHCMCSDVMLNVKFGVTNKY